MSTGFENNNGHYTHQTSYSQRERTVGLFLFFGFLLCLFFIVISVNNEHLFEERVTFYIDVNSSDGINQGTTVKALGEEVGKVSKLKRIQTGKIRITLDVYEKQHELIREGAITIVNRLTNIGSALIEIKSDSTDAPILAEGSIIPVNETVSLNDLLFSMASLIQAANKKDVLSRVDTLLPKLEKTLENLHVIFEQIASGQGTLGAAIFDSEVEKDLRVVVKSGATLLTESQGLITLAKQRLIQVEPLLNETQSMVKDVGGMSKKLPALVKELREIVTLTNTALTLMNGELKDISGTSNKVKRTLSKTNRLLDSVQNTWPLSDNSEKTEQSLLIPPHSNHE